MNIQYFGRELKENNVLVNTQQSIDYASIKKRKAKKEQNKIVIQEQIVKESKYKIKKQDNIVKVKVLDIIDSDKEDDVDDSQQYRVQEKVKGLHDFIQEDNSDQMQKPIEVQPVDLVGFVQNEQGIQDLAVKDFADFMQQDEQEQQQKQEKKLQEINQNQETIQKQEINQSSKKQHKIQHESNFFLKELELKEYSVIEEEIFLKNIVPPNTQVRLWVKQKDAKTYSFYLGNFSIASCYNQANEFIFQCVDGPVARMEIINNTYEVFLFDQSYDMMPQHYASIYFSDKSIQKKKFSTMQIYLSQLQSMWPKQIFENNQNNQVKIYQTRDPKINEFGKLQLKIENVQNIRPSTFNCLIEDNKLSNVCSFLHTDRYEINVMRPFNPILAIACAVSRLDWNKRYKQL